MKKYKLYLTFGLIILCCTSMLGQQLDIEVNGTNKAGLKIKNLDATAASASYLDFNNNDNKLFQLGMTGSNNTFFGGTPNVAYLFTRGGENVPIVFATNGIERMRIHADGRIGIGDKSSPSLLKILSSDMTILDPAVQIRQLAPSRALEIISESGGPYGLSVIGVGMSKAALVQSDSSTALSLKTLHGSDIGLSLSHRGIGNAAVFEVNNSSSTGSTLRLDNNGIGSCLFSVNTGTGEAGFFQSNSTIPTARFLNLGSGHSLFVDGTAMRQDANPNWDITSDKRLKKDISSFTAGLSIIALIKPVKFRYNGLCGFSDKKENVGIIAQEIMEIAPYMVEYKRFGIGPLV